MQKFVNFSQILISINMETEYIYSPIVKWRPAEIKAFTDILDVNKKHILPIIEIVLPSVERSKTVIVSEKKTKIRKTNEEIHNEMVSKYRNIRLQTIPNEIEKSWGNSKILVDFNLIHDGSNTVNLKIESLEKVTNYCSEKGLNIIPVIYLNDNQSLLEKVIKLFNDQFINGICIRIITSDLKKIDELNEKLDKFIKNSNISINEIDLLVDINYLDDNTKLIYKSLFLDAQSIYSLKDWKTFIFSSGSFPADVSKHKAEDSPSSEPRLDWQYWLEASKDITTLVRKPIFSDYTIRNPRHSDASIFMQSSATLKYSYKNEWLIFKGEVQNYPQYLAHAYTLVNDTDFFYGENFSAGDKYIADKAKHLKTYLNNPKVKGTGRSGDWISAGVSHHLALALSQISNQP